MVRAHNLCISALFLLVPFFLYIILVFPFLSFPFAWLFFISHSHLIYFMPIHTHTHIANCLALKYQELYNTYMYYITTTIRSGFSLHLLHQHQLFVLRVCFEFSVSNERTHAHCPIWFDLLAFFSSLIERSSTSTTTTTSLHCFASHQFYQAPQSEYWLSEIITK